MPILPQFHAQGKSGADFQIIYQDTWDLWSLRWYLAQAVSPKLAAGLVQTPEEGEAYVYVEPIKGTFARPAITIQLITGVPIKHLAVDPSSDISQRCALRVYHATHDGVMALSEAVRRSLGSVGGHFLRIPAWGWWEPDSNGEPQTRLRLGRFLRVSQESLAMSLEEPDDDRMWSRTLEMTFSSPRNRAVASYPAVSQITLRFNGRPWVVGTGA